MVMQSFVCRSSSFNYFKIFVEYVRSTFQVDSEKIWKQAGVYGDKEPPKKKVGATVVRRSVTTLVHQNDRENVQNVADLLARSVTTASKTYRRKQMRERASLATNAISKALRFSSTLTKPPVKETVERYIMYRNM